MRSRSPPVCRDAARCARGVTRTANGLGGRTATRHSCLAFSDSSLKGGTRCDLDRLLAAVTRPGVPAASRGPPMRWAAERPHVTAAWLSQTALLKAAHEAI